MKGKKKLKIVLIILIILLFVILGGYLYMKHQEKELMQEQKPRIEKFMHYNFNDIKSITLTGTYTNPTGITHIEGYINDNKKLWIDASVSGKNGVEVVNVIDYIDDHYVKPEFKYKFKNVTDIEAEEKAKGKSSTAEPKKDRSVAEIYADMKATEADILKSNRRNNNNI